MDNKFHQLIFGFVLGLFYSFGFVFLDLEWPFAGSLLDALPMKGMAGLFLLIFIYSIVMLIVCMAYFMLINRLNIYSAFSNSWGISIGFFLALSVYIGLGVIASSRANFIL